MGGDREPMKRKSQVGDKLLEVQKFRVLWAGYFGYHDSQAIWVALGEKQGAELTCLELVFW